MSVLCTLGKSLPELPHVIVRRLFNHQRPLVFVAPDQLAVILRVLLEHIEVRRGEELAVEHALAVREPVPFQLPQLDLIDDGGRQRVLALLLDHLGVRVLPEVAYYLVGSDATPQGLSY